MYSFINNPYNIKSSYTIFLIKLTFNKIKSFYFNKGQKSYYIVYFNILMKFTVFDDCEAFYSKLTIFYEFYNTYIKWSF